MASGKIPEYRPKWCSEKCEMKIPSTSRQSYLNGHLSGSMRHNYIVVSGIKDDIHSVLRGVCKKFGEESHWSEDKSSAIGYQYPQKVIILETWIVQ
jgi:hypothetical protein